MAQKDSMQVDSLEYIYQPNLENYVFAQKNHLMGVIDDNRKTIIPFEYDGIYQTWYNNFTGIDTFIVKKNDKFGTVDFYNNIVIPIEYDGISDWVEWGPDGHYVMKDGHYGLIAHNGSIIIPLIYDGINYLSYDCIEVMKDNKFGILNYKNQVIIPCIYEALVIDINFFDFIDKNIENKYEVKHNGIWTFFDLNGGIIRDNIPAKEVENNININELNKNDFDYVKICMIFSGSESRK
jgi:hypothetical protein